MIDGGLKLKSCKINLNIHNNDITINLLESKIRDQSNKPARNKIRTKLIKSSIFSTLFSFSVTNYYDNLTQEKYVWGEKLFKRRHFFGDWTFSDGKKVVEVRFFLGRHTYIYTHNILVQQEQEVLIKLVI